MGEGAEQAEWWRNAADATAGIGGCGSAGDGATPAAGAATASAAGAGGAAGTGGAAGGAATSYGAVTGDGAGAVARQIRQACAVAGHSGPALPEPLSTDCVITGDEPDDQGETPSVKTSVVAAGASHRGATRGCVEASECQHDTADVAGCGGRWLVHVSCEPAAGGGH